MKSLRERVTEAIRKTMTQQLSQKVTSLDYESVTNAVFAELIHVTTPMARAGSTYIREGVHKDEERGSFENSKQQDANHIWQAMLDEAWEPEEEEDASP